MPDIFKHLTNVEYNNEESRTEERKRLKDLIQQNLPRYTEENLFGLKEEKIPMLKGYMLEIIRDSNTFLRNYEIEEFLDELVLEITNLGKLTFLMVDPTVSEVMINSYNDIWVERHGELEKVDFSFENEEEVFELARRIARNVGRLVDNLHPLVNARLPDGSRVNITIPPISKNGITITIRKFFQEKLQIEDLIKFGSINEELADFLKAAVTAKCNLIVSGGTSSGKTTMLNVLSNFIPGNERIITIEDAAELQLNNEHIISLETREANAEGEGAVEIHTLATNSLRMRPDRIIIGEVRNHVAYDLLSSMGTGHEGSMSTIHANDEANCITRLTNLALEKNLGIDKSGIHTMIGESLDIIVQVLRLQGGLRKVVGISQVIPSESRVKVEPIFSFVPEGLDEKGRIKGSFVRTKNKLSERILKKFLFSGIEYNDPLNEK